MNISRVAVCIWHCELWSWDDIPLVEYVETSSECPEGVPCHQIRNIRISKHLQISLSANHSAEISRHTDILPITKDAKSRTGQSPHSNYIPMCPSFHLLLSIRSTSNWSDNLLTFIVSFSLFHAVLSFFKPTDQIKSAFRSCSIDSKSQSPLATSSWSSHLELVSKPRISGLWGNVQARRTIAHVLMQ